jgi:thioredoxin-like negative regulator of GroEL
LDSPYHLKEPVMTAVAFCVLLQSAVLGADAVPYSEAHKTAQTNDQPLVVLVGADWCPGCVKMKRNVIPSLVRRGKLQNVQFTMVNPDDDPALARKLMRGTSIPQLIVYSRSGEGWQREQLTGPKSEGEVEALVERAIAQQAKAPKLAEVR